MHKFCSNFEALCLTHDRRTSHMILPHITYESMEKIHKNELLKTTIMISLSAYYQRKVIQFLAQFFQGIHNKFQ